MSRHRLVVSSCLVAAVLAGPAAAQTLEPMTQGLVPVVAHLPGANGSYWTTDMYVRQAAGTAPATVTYTVLGASGTSWTSTLTLAANQGSATVADVVGAAGAVPDGKYILRWWSTQPVVLTTRTFTTEDGRTLGQGTGSVAPGSGFGPDGTVVLPAPMGAGDHRVNVGLANSGTGAQSFHVQALDALGSTASAWDVTVAPGAIEQFRSNLGMTGTGSVEVRCTSGCDGTAFAYVSVAVNDSNDAFFMYAAAAAGESATAPVMTTRDAKGVWFITGGTLYDVFEAMGYAVASDRLWQTETFRRSARGTLAEVFGADYVNTDVLVRTTGYSEDELQDAFDALDSESKTVITAYVDGFNRRIAEVRADESILPFEFRAIAAQMHAPFVPADWTVTDVLAWISLLLRNFDPEAQATGQLDNAMLFQHLAAAYPAEYAAMFGDLRWINDPSAPTMIPHATTAATAQAARPHLPDPGAFPDLGGAATRIRSRHDDARAKMEKLNAYVKMGSYAWVVSGDRTASGRPIIYSGPQMGFTAPAIVMEGSIRGGGLAVSGMTVAGIPGIIIGRTPHHAWSMQVGHAHTTDYYLEAPQAVHLNRMETIHVAGGDDVTIPVFRSSHGPIVDPIPYDPGNPPATIVSWKYSQWGYELSDTIRFALGAARATSMDAFGAALELAAVSQHFCYADRDGNIAYWMSGRDPVRPAGVDPRFPLLGDGSQEWPQPVTLKTRATDRNTAQGFYGGWNNKAAVWYDNAPNSLSYYLGPAHRAKVIQDALAAHAGWTYDEVRDLALNIATTDSFGGGGNTWDYVKERFAAAVAAHPSANGTDALEMLDDWDGHFVDGGPSQWVSGALRADAWVLQDAWIREMIRLTFEDEFEAAGIPFSSRKTSLLFNVLLRALDGQAAALPTAVDWFADRSSSGKPTDADGLIALALDNVMSDLGPRPWLRNRGAITYRHDLIGIVATTPFASRSTYAHVVEYGPNGPVRIESMFPLGESGTILMGPGGMPEFDPDFSSMRPVFDAFAPRPFPLFD